MKILPLPKKLYDEAHALDVAQIVINFEGGSDEGDISVSFRWREFDSVPKKESRKTTESLLYSVENWVGTAYEYSGAGDGTPYGDSITYDLEKNQVEHQSWQHEVVYGATSTEALTTDSPVLPAIPSDLAPEAIYFRQNDCIDWYRASNTFEVLVCQADGTKFVFKLEDLIHKIDALVALTESVKRK